MECQNYAKQLTYALLCTVLCFTSAALLHAQEQLPAQKQKVIYHQESYSPYNLPAAGDEILLRTQVLYSKNVNNSVFAVLTHDNKMTVTQADKSFLNQFDQSEYHFTTFAPKAELTYQFFSVQEDGQTLISPLYNIRRECRYPTEMQNSKIPDSLRGLPRVSLVVDTTRALEREVKSYDYAKKLLSNIQDELIRIKRK